MHVHGRMFRRHAPRTFGNGAEPDTAAVVPAVAVVTQQNVLLQWACIILRSQQSAGAPILQTIGVLHTHLIARRAAHRAHFALHALPVVCADHLDELG